MSGFRFFAVFAFALNAGASVAQDPQTFQDCPDCPEMTVLPDGSAMSTTLVTRGQFSVFANETGVAPDAGCFLRAANDWTSDPTGGWGNPGFAQADDHPAVCVSWVEATAYADWLTGKTGKLYRLPSFEESAAAAAAGTTTAYWWGDDFAQVCEFANGADEAFRAAFPQDKRKLLTCDDGFAHTAPVRTFGPNAWGLYDPAGNAWQWTNSCLKGDCANAIFRGPGWAAPNPDHFKPAGQWADRILLRNASVGFRIMLDAPGG
jgi:formylglycine-generating enzyme required for sulfatase activity